MAIQPSQFLGLGFAPPSPAGGVVLTYVDNTACWAIAFGFVPSENHTVSSFRWFTGAVTGTAQAHTVAVYSDTGAGVPGASLGSVSVAAPTAFTWINATGLSVPVTAGVQYWVVLTCATASSTNKVQARYGGTATAPSYGNTGNKQGWNLTTATNAGLTAWSAALAGPCGYRIGYDSDTVFDGIPTSNVLTSDQIFGTREVGVKLVTPPFAKWNIRGIWFYFTTITAAPTVGLKAKLYTGSATPATPASYVAISPTLQVQGLATGGWVRFDFGSTITVNPGTTCRLTWLEDTNADAALRYQGWDYTWDPDANSQQLVPFAGTSAGTGNGAKKTSYNGTTWTDSTTTVHPFLILLDATAPDSDQGAVGALGSLLVHPGLVGGVRA